MPTITEAIAADTASSTSRTWDRVIPILRKFRLSALPAIPIALDDLASSDRRHAERDQAERNKNDDERPQRFVDRIRLLTANRLQIVTQCTRPQPPDRVEPRSRAQGRRC